MTDKKKNNKNHIIATEIGYILMNGNGQAKQAAKTLSCTHIFKALSEL